MIKIIIADDEKHARDRLKQLLQNYDFLKIIAEAENGNQVLENIIESSPDLAFLDINMPGVSVFNTIVNLKNPPFIVFQTAYSEYAVKAFELEAFDYLVKPVSQERLDKTIQKLQKSITVRTIGENPKNQQQNDPSRISLKINGVYHVFSLNSLIRISFEQGFCFVYNQEGRFLLDGYLNHYEKKLDSQGFFRINRNDLVNIAYIKKIHSFFQGSYIIELTDKTELQLSRRRISDLKKIMSF